MKILHIAAHVGGGIGSAYAGLGTCHQEQSILLLEKPLDLATLKRVEAAGFRILIGLETKQIEQELLAADLIVFSWYHHPALTKFLCEFPHVPIRSIVWCHISGNYFPQIPAELLTMFDHCLFASPFSLNLPQIQNLGTEFLQEKSSVVYGLNDLSRFSSVEKSGGHPFTIGYVGTLGFCKLHPDFVRFCRAADDLDVRFLMVGSPPAREEILAGAAQNGIVGQFEFAGQLPDVTQALKQMDVFSYLLNPQHFGATENSLLEAMAVGLPVIALDQCVERIIIRDGETGLLVHSPEEYGQAVRFLRDHPSEAARLGAAARKDVMKRYSIQTNQQRFLTACERGLKNEKRIHNFKTFFTGDPVDYFLTAVSDTERACFEKAQFEDLGLIFRERTKGSPIHYHSYFPEDQRLTEWVKALL